jgi:hypothetical protein
MVVPGRSLINALRATAFGPYRRNIAQDPRHIFGKVLVYTFNRAIGSRIYKRKVILRY